MSTEAQRASHPPRPAVPPPPSTPPRPAHPPRQAEAGTDAPDRRTPAPRRAERPASTEPSRGTVPGGPPGTPGPSADGAGPRGRTSGGTGAFDLRGPAVTPRGSGPAAPGTTGPGDAAGHGGTAAAPAPGDAPASRPRLPGSGAAVPAGTPPTAPPPRASARFPDAPPTAGRGTRPPAAVPPQPGHRLTARRTGEPTAAPGDAPGTQSAGATGAAPAGWTTGGVGSAPVAPAGRTTGTTGTTGSAGSVFERSAGATGAAPAGRTTGTTGTTGSAGSVFGRSAGATGAAPTTGTPETPEGTTTRLRPVPADPHPGPAARPAGPGRPRTPDHRTPALPPVPPRPAPDPARSWGGSTAPGGTPGAGRPVVSFGTPEGYDEGARPRPFGRRGRYRAVAATACLVLGTGLIGGAVTGSWLAGDSGGAPARSGFAAAGDIWHNVPVDELFPPTVQGQGAGPGGADRTWIRVAVAPDSGCKGAFDPLLRKALAPVGCERLLRATYTDATQSHVTTVGLLFTRADATGMASLARRFDRERLDRRPDMMPLPYAAKGTAAAGFGADQRASWAISVLTDAPVVVYAVSGWADGRAVDTPQPAEEAMESGATTAPAQSGLGNEARGLADRVERGLRKNAGSATERPS